MEESKLWNWGVIRSLLAILQWWGFNVTVIIMNKWIFQVPSLPSILLLSHFSQLGFACSCLCCELCFHLWIFGILLFFSFCFCFRCVCVLIRHSEIVACFGGQNYFVSRCFSFTFLLHLKSALLEFSMWAAAKDR